jgi:hypothetical protein
VELSFQRYPEPPADSLWAPPRSFGALPCGTHGEATVVVPVAAGEAIWIAIEPGRESDRYEASFDFELRAAGPRPRTEIITVRVRVPPSQNIDGIALPGGTIEPIVRASTVEGRGCCACIRLSLGRISGEAGAASAAAITIKLASPEDFAALTGRDPGPPLDTSHGYKGDLLP